MSYENVKDGIFRVKKWNMEIHYDLAKDVLTISDKDGGRIKLKGAKITELIGVLQYDIEKIILHESERKRDEEQEIKVKKLDKLICKLLHNDNSQLTKEERDIKDELLQEVLDRGRSNIASMFMSNGISADSTINKALKIAENSP